jgi:hypothetical protein
MKCEQRRVLGGGREPGVFIIHQCPRRCVHEIDHAACVGVQAGTIVDHPLQGRAVERVQLGARQPTCGSYGASLGRKKVKSELLRDSAPDDVPVGTLRPRIGEIGRYAPKRLEYPNSPGLKDHIIVVVPVIV